jgi:hypothetical protein
MGNIAEWSQRLDQRDANDQERCLLVSKMEAFRYLIYIQTGQWMLRQWSQSIFIVILVDCRFCGEHTAVSTPVLSISQSSEYKCVALGSADPDVNIFDYLWEEDQVNLSPRSHFSSTSGNFVLVLFDPPLNYSFTANFEKVRQTPPFGRMGEFLPRVIGAEMCFCMT